MVSDPSPSHFSRITDIHIHIQPWRDLKPNVQAVMRAGKEDHWDFLLSLMDDPKALLQVMDKAGVWRVGLVNYPSPDIMGFTDSTNDFAARYASANPERLLPYGGVHPRFSTNPAADVDRLVDLGIRMLKIHPNHQAFPANAYTEGLDSLAAIYRRCEERGLPVLIHTGTSIFPGARSKWGNPLEMDDVAIDFPDLQLVMAHGGRPLYMEEAFFILRRHRRVRLDVSGIPPLKLLDYFPRLMEIGDRVLWGTDWPSPGVKDLRGNIDQLLTLP
ncbi:MAG TPA: amidohydrolase family protein, partial [Gemmatimonadales bacterium]|nr:amidohydrolase family protein [Gemmatimonadales bacterium]